MHLTRHHDSGKLSFLIRSGNQQLHYFEYDENIDPETPNHSITRIYFRPPFISIYKVVGSFNGVVCLYGWRDYAHCICNPVTKEYVMLPNIKRDCGDKYFHRSSGFGYLPATNEYKVVEFYKLKREPSFIEVVVFTLGSGKGWRNVGRLGSKLCRANGVFLNGALHWMDEERERVFAFDLTEEKFRQHITLPPFPPNDNWYTSYTSYTLGELGGVLYYFQETEELYSDIWILKEKNDNLDMKEQVEHEPLGWRKEFSLPRKTPLAFTKSGDVLCFDCYSLYIRDPIASASKKLVDSVAFHQIIPYKKTLVSLKGIGEKDIKTMESAEIEETKSHYVKPKQLAGWYRWIPLLAELFWRLLGKSGNPNKD